MNPYGIVGNRVDPIALARWTADNKRAHDAYERDPIIACMGIRRNDGEEEPCQNSRTFGVLCKHCHDERLKAAGRMRERRAS